MAAVLIATVAIGALVSIDIGFVFYSQRQLQKTVDLAALSGAQQLKRADDVPTTTANVMASVNAAASQNGYAGVAANCADVAAGAADGLRVPGSVWDPANAANGDAVRHFNPATTRPRVAQRVRVQATLTVPCCSCCPAARRGSCTRRPSPPAVRPLRRSRSAAACWTSIRPTAS
jgi:uncharacterized membrane protein